MTGNHIHIEISPCYKSHKYLPSMLLPEQQLGDAFSALSV